MSDQTILEPTFDHPTHVRSIPNGLYSQSVRHGKGPLAGLIRRHALHPVYQPIVSLADGSIHAHEALIRGPQNTPFHTPDVLLEAAEIEHLNFEFESYCASAAMIRWSEQGESGRLFVNISAEVLVQVLRQCGPAVLLHDFGVLPRRLVLEITEYERVSDMDYLARIVGDIRAAGVSFALDDFGDGRSSLRLWSQLKPEYVKIDKYFTRDISQCANKLKTLQALQQIAIIFNSALVAEGIENEADLRVLRDLGIAYGQGFFLGRPAPHPRQQIYPQAQAVISDGRVSVFPELRRACNAGALNRFTVIEAPAIGLTTTNEELADLFINHPGLHAAAMLDDACPVGIINKSQFMNEFSKLYYREVWGSKPCLMHANLSPRLIERQHNVDDLVGILTSDDQRYLTDGFIVTDNGRYVGLGTGDQLVKSVTETRIEAARHANPLTFLPGNIPISQHIERLLNKHAEFVACYADLNNFKPFNDQYGYWRGDEMIRLLASICVAHCDPQRDFVGHVGGDDFILLFQNANWHIQCRQIIDEFAQRARTLFDESARLAGGISAEDRYGIARFFSLTTLSIGAVKITRHAVASAEQVASWAANAKHRAKARDDGLFVQDTPDTGYLVADRKPSV